VQRLSGVELKNGAVSIFGAFDFDQRAEGVSPRRLPAWTRPQLPQPMDVMARMPSGVRLAFDTDSRNLELSVQTTKFVAPPMPARLPTFDLVVDGKDAASQSSDRGNTIVINRENALQFELIRGEPYTVSFTNLARGKKRCEIWLPHNAYVELRALEIDDGATLTAEPAPREKRWIHHGSSISHCMEARSPTGTWPAVAARHAGLHLTSLGFGGQCHLDPYVARTIRDAEADLVSIKVGINVINMDSMRERVFMPALHGFLDTIRERKPTTPIVLISPIYCPSAEHTPGPTLPSAEGKFVTIPGNELLRTGCLTLTRVREIIGDVVATRRELGDRNLRYLNGLELFGVADASDLPDDLHPSPEGYARMGERFARWLATNR
jgi:hypothetical protein